MLSSSYFIPNKALFGSYPSQEAVNELEKEGVKYFINLTEKSENLPEYKTNFTSISYSIEDRKIPRNEKTFSALILKLNQILHDGNNGKIYVHCKGGHGRAGIVVACLLCVHLGQTPALALHNTSRYHDARPNLKDRWRKLGSPQGLHQKNFVHRIFRELRYNSYKLYPEFCDSYPCTITMSELGDFPSALCALLSYKDPKDSRYISDLKNGIIDKNRPWKTSINKEKILEKVLFLKFFQNKTLMEKLLQTGLHKLTFHYSDTYFGDGRNGSGKNVHGTVLAKVREHFLLNIPLQ